MKNEEKLKRWGLAGSEKYYYLKFGHGAINIPDGFMGIATVCVIGQDSVEGAHYVRGIAFCNPKDQFNRRLGRNIALGRAVKAIENRCNADPIPTRKPASVLHKDLGWYFLSCWYAELTSYEQRLFSGGE